VFLILSLHHFTFLTINFVNCLINLGNFLLLDQSRFHHNTQNWELGFKTFVYAACRSGEIVKLSVLYLTISVVPYNQCCTVKSVLCLTLSVLYYTQRCTLELLPHLTLFVVAYTLVLYLTLVFVHYSQC